MEDPFILEVTYKQTQHAFTAQLQLTGYTHRFIVTLPQLEIWFERDEEGAYRAVVPPGTPVTEAEKLDVALLQAIALQIETILQ